MKKYTRRELMKCLLAGGMVTAAGLWIPGQKLISIPKVMSNEYGIDSTFRLLDYRTVEYSGRGDKVVSVKEFQKWMRDNAAHMLRRTPDDVTMVSFDNGFNMVNPEHLTEGVFTQDASDSHCTIEPLRELWSCPTTIGSDELVTDKIYFVDHMYSKRVPAVVSAYAPRDRAWEDGLGLLPERLIVTESGLTGYK